MKQWFTTTTLLLIEYFINFINLHYISRINRNRKAVSVTKVFFKHVKSVIGNEIAFKYHRSTHMVWWRAPRAESTCKWPSESLVWGHNGGRGNLPNLHHFNSNFLPRRVDGSKQIIKLFLHLSCLFVWHLARTKHNLRARHVLSDLARANYGTSVVAECNAWSAGKSTNAARLQLCAPVTKVRKRGGRPQPPASEKPGITATLTERSQDPTHIFGHKVNKWFNI